MNIKQKVITNLPRNITLVSKKVSYISHQSILLQRNMTASEVYVLLTSNQPKWLSLLFNIRDILGKLVGLKEIKGFRKIKESDIFLKSKAHFFNVKEVEDTKLVLEIKDYHLDVCLCLIIINNNLHLVTSVKNHNIIGNIYMFPVSIVHKIIVKILLKNII